MIDFRYHLVSLVSVFLALAVGIILGAGPLKEPIGESLQSQVDALRTDRDDLRAQLDAANGNIERQNEFVTAAAPELIGGTLTDATVTVVAAPEAQSEQVEQVTNLIQEAGGTIGSDVSLTENTLSVSQAGDFLTTLRGIVPGLPEDDATAIRAALVIALTGQASTIAEGTERDDAQNRAAEIFTAFVDAGRLRTDTDAQTTDLFVLIDDEGSQLADATVPSPEATDDRSAREVVTEFVNALTADATSVVVAGDAVSAQSGLVSVLRTEKSRATTVDGLGLSAGAVIAVRAIAAGSAGTQGHFGFASDAESILPGRQ